ncbi:MAG TPA: hypothetical protein PLP49_12180 [Anaerohalosphaeraceae bacterium]|nr:hypothetical protein [Anaerohalosphaeraceae bacterium]
MRTSEIMKKFLKGAYVVLVRPCTRPSESRVVKKLEFENLYSAIDYALWLTFEKCEKERKITEEKKNKASDDISIYDVRVLLRKDFWQEDCLKRYAEEYPTIYHIYLRKPKDTNKKS